MNWLWFRKSFLLFLLPVFMITTRSAASHAALQYEMIEITEPAQMRIYQPPLTDGVVYPVLYLFHGQWQQLSIWDDIGVLDDLNVLLAAGEIEPFYVVMPREQAYLKNMYETDFPQVFLETILPWVEENYPVSDQPGQMAVGGISRGALWAQYFGFMQYGRFEHIGVHSPPNAFFSMAKIYRLIQDSPDVPFLRIRIDIGNHDYQVRTGQDFSDQLTQLFYPHEFHLGVGGHDVAYWSEYFPDYLRWYDRGFRAKN